MARTGRPAATLDEWLDWQQRLASQQASGLSVDVYCLQEGVTRSSFYRWHGRLKSGVLPVHNPFTNFGARARIRKSLRAKRLRSSSPVRWGSTEPNHLRTLESAG